MRQISICIPTYNRFELLIESFKQVLHDDRVSEVVIVDDCSTDGSYGKIVGYFHTEPKVRIFRNLENVDCYRNKREALLSATNEWCILLDSDNVITTEYIDRLFDIPEWKTETIYQPAFAKPHFDFTKFSGLTVTKSNVAKNFTKPMFSTMLNAANFFINQYKYLCVWDGSVNPHTADSIFHSYNHLRSGGEIYVVPGLYYEHRVHDGSHYKNNVHKTGNFYQEVEQKILKLK